MTVYPTKRDNTGNTLAQEAAHEQQTLNRFEEALVFAARRHREQRRKGTEILYVSHLLQVAGLVMENGGGEDEAIAALLHDVMEDQGVTGQELASRFGPAVAAIVAGCSDSPSTDKAPWRRRKEAYIAHLADAPRPVRLVSSCDKLHNARALLADHREIGEALWERFSAGGGEVLWYYRSLLGAFQEAQERHGEPPSRVVAELGLVVGELSRRVEAAAVDGTA